MPKTKLTVSVPANAPDVPPAGVLREPAVAGQPDVPSGSLDTSMEGAREQREDLV